MKYLAENGKYSIPSEMQEKLKDFKGYYATEEETANKIKNLYESTGYIIDTHTAVAAVAYDKYQADSNDKKKTIIASTASPFKFTRSVMNAIDNTFETMTDFELVDKLSEIGNVSIPNAIEEIREAKVLHNHICEKEEMVKEIKKFLGM